MQALTGIWSLIQAGGWVMYPLLALSLVSLTVTLERTAFWLSRSARVDRSLIDRLLRALTAADWSGTIAEADNERSVHARLAAALAVEARRAGTLPVSAALAAAERFRPAVERFSTIQATIITAAPMLGILGTVTGIIQSFQFISGEDGSVGTEVADPSLVAAGIAEALFTTAVGLVVALLTLFPYALFRAAGERCLATFETIAAAAHEGAQATQPATEPATPEETAGKAPAATKPNPGTTKK